MRTVAEIQADIKKFYDSYLAATEPLHREMSQAKQVEMIDIFWLDSDWREPDEPIRHAKVKRPTGEFFGINDEEFTSENENGQKFTGYPTAESLIIGTAVSHLFEVSEHARMFNEIKDRFLVEFPCLESYRLEDWLH